MARGITVEYDEAPADMIKMSDSVLEAALRQAIDIPTDTLTLSNTSAIVDLDDGGTLKGNLIDCDPDPEKIKFDMPVEVVFDDALGRKDAEGNSYISYFFKPIN